MKVLSGDLRARDVMKTNFDIVNGKDTVRQVLANMQYPETSVLVVNKRHADDVQDFLFRGVNRVFYILN